MTTAAPSVTVVVPGSHLMAELLGERDEHLRRVEGAFPDVSVSVRGNEIACAGPRSHQVGKLFEEMVLLLQRGERLDASVMDRSIIMVRAEQRPSAVLTDDILKGARGRMVRPKTAGQKRYVDAIRQNTVTFAIGPAGTGKSWLAVAMAVQALHAREVQRIILTRPAVEAGERLGFLPGDLMAKIDPYLKPLYDALYDMVDAEAAQKLIERQSVEVAPLAFMRGRTLNNSFIILDEAQNTTVAQMKMFLTRLGHGSKMVISGDTTQIDLPADRSSGLVDAMRRLQDVPGCGRVQLGGADIVRHPLVQRIVEAYDR